MRKLIDNPRSTEFYLERYKYILQQINASNENVYRFLALYQSLATGIFGAGLLLFVSFREWGISAGVAHAALIGLLCLMTIVASFTTLLVISGLLSWLDYRREECVLTEELFGPGFREPPRISNFYRWNETYIICFVLMSTVFAWLLVLRFAIPNMAE
ncbi:hypothetical protein O7553_03370 [Solwaraspora sp. WMMA2059]|uniref:hypothetical protein n=1 Tax=Solwaraspora sp. WMMA2059 TaxID=3015160 RepID=UPI00248C1ECB|nr:hypothetical protein [Solwaraspora sp. WMMA2059]WBB98012.1 hypothetical protein O7553_03370 [Solwaraspora sp. WMMA2059]